VALPVNFKILAGSVILRSALDGTVAAIASKEPVSFEVDRIDDAMSEGPSVLSSGTVQSVRAPEQIHEFQALGIEPWAGGERDTYFRLSVTSITGKRINAVC
jgi:nitroimidazol reductase NimA-like FMN-containing flavoprotein (pyridoxamine 5'-phosphate oxidase superfamily)